MYKQQDRVGDILAHPRKQFDGFAISWECSVGRHHRMGEVLEDPRSTAPQTDRLEVLLQMVEFSTINM